MKKQKGEQKPLPILPNEITEEILARLPVKSLLRFRCVSKSWYNLISDPRFIKLQLDRAIESGPQKIILECDRKLLSVEFEAFDRTSAKILDVPLDYPVECIRLGGSCNGLICFSEKNSLYVWNPFSRIYKELPNAPFSSWDHFLSFKMGIGYSPRTDEYKVIKFVNYERSSYASEVFVHTLGMHSWRSIARFPSGICLFTCGAFLNGALHWVAAHGTGAQTKLISVLDLGEEKFTEMQLPDFGNGIIPSNITVLGEHLSIYCHFEFMDCFEIWVMKEYGNENSWTKQFSDRQMKLDENNGYLQLLGFRRSGEILLQKDYSKISLYNLVNKRIRDLQIQGRPLVFEAYTSVESLVPPKVGYNV